jgi:hypothetical protein
LGGVHLLATLPFEQNRFDLGVKEFTGLRVPGIEPVVVDQEGLMLQPVTPARSADLLVHFLSDGVSKGGLLEPWGGLPATSTTNGIHRDLETRGLSMVDRERIKLQDPLCPSREEIFFVWFPSRVDGPQRHG